MANGRIIRWQSRSLRLLLVALVLLLIAFSPLALNLAGRASLDWPLLGDVGDAYGAISSLLAGLALIGVAVSTTMEARQTRLSVEQAARDMQLQIFDMAFKDEDLLACIGPKFDKQHLYTNIWIMYQRMRLQIGDGHFGEFYDIARDVFQTEPGRRYWTLAGPHFQAHWRDNAFNRRFVDTLEAAYRDTAPPVIDLPAESVDVTGEKAAAKQDPAP